MSQEQKKPQKSAEAEESTEELPVESASDVEVDDILDEIDEVLEKNAEEFVTGFIQRGGE